MLAQAVLGDELLAEPSSVGEPPGDGLARSPEARRSTRQYVRNRALWLAGRAPDLS